MTDRVGRWGRAPIRGVEPAFDHRAGYGEVADDGDPTGARHAFDQDAALTPIFTTLRRGGWRCPPQQSRGPAWAPAPAPRPQPGPRTLRPVPDTVTRFRDDPLTAPFPTVPADTADAPWADGPGVDPYAPSSFALVAASSPDATTWWSGPLVGGSAPTPPADGLTRPHPHVAETALRPVPAYDAAPHEAGFAGSGYDGAGYDGAGYAGHHDSRSYDGRGYDDGGYGGRGYGGRGYGGYSDDEQGYERAYGGPGHLEPGYGEGYAEQGHEQGYGRGYDRGYAAPGYPEPVRLDSRRARRFPDPVNPVADSGRHHHLAPAGW